MEKNYRKVKAIEYVKTILLFEEAKTILAEKICGIKVIEKSDYYCTVCVVNTLTGEPVTDEYGRMSRFYISINKIRDTYTLVSGFSDVYKPKNLVNMFISVLSDIEIECHGIVYKVDAGSYLNITNFDDIYPVSESDFNTLYYELSSEEELLKFKLNS